MYLLFILLFPLALGSFLLLAKPKNAFLISLPLFVLIGMFCKLGLLLLSLPVTATA
jgi:hypothetical protein